MRLNHKWFSVVATLGVLTVALPAVAQKPKPKASAEASPKKPSADKSRERKASKKGKAEKNSDGPAVVKVEKEKEEGVKTYTFGAVEVEGRLKSPQIIYFLRRVRAEFSSGALGHRSFLRELSDTRRSPALR